MLKVGEWFLINRDVIDENEEVIRQKCYNAGRTGATLHKRFEKSNKIANENPDKYPRLIQTYIFIHMWECKKIQEMRDICTKSIRGGRMCDEVICDLELQMRICNGESVDDLVKKVDKLPYIRLIQLINGGTGFFGGGTNFRNDTPPANLRRTSFSNYDNCNATPYAYRKVSFAELNIVSDC